MRQILTLAMVLLLISVSQLYAETTPQFSFTDLEGKTYSSSDLKGTPLVINVAAHW